MDTDQAAIEFKKQFPLFFLEENDSQRKFIHLKNSEGMTPKRRLFEAGNKCLTYNSLVECPDGEIPVGVLYERGKPFDVFAYDGEKKVVAKASAPFMVGSHRCYRFEMSDGRWIETADYHRILTSFGWMTSSDLHDTYFHSLFHSNSASCLSVRDSGVVHLSQKQLDFLSGCPAGSRLCDVRPLSSKGIFQDVAPLSAGVLQRIFPRLHLGVLAYKYKRILFGLFDRLSNLGVLNRFLGRFVEFLNQGAYTIFQSSRYAHPLFQQPSTVAFFPTLSDYELYPDLYQSDSGVSFTSSFVGNYIINITLIPNKQEVYDFSVEKYGNYYAGGLINHNCGKTEIGIAEDLAHAWGCRIWLPKNHPDYKIDIRMPNLGLIGCETMAHSVPEKIWPTLKKLIPNTCKWRSKNNQSGFVQKIMFETNPFGQPCESEIHIRSYNEEATTFEGIDYHWAHWDEPPPKPVLQAAERGKVAQNAPSWFTMTPLKEAYIYDEYSLKAENNGGDDPQIGIVRGEIWDNCIDFCHKCKVDIPENRKLDENYELIRPVKKCPQCDRTMGFILREGIEEYLKTLDPEEREAREKGLWKHLSGLVYKTLDRDVHVYDDFPIPRSWMKIEGIDPHDAHPTCYLFAAVSPEEIEIVVNEKSKVRYRIYIYDYLMLKEDIDTIVRKINEKRAHHGYSRPKWIILDQKYGLRTQKQSSDMDARNWQDELIRRGLGNIRLSMSRPGDVELGHKLVREYLKYNKSSLTGELKPGILFAREGCKGSGGPIHHMFNYQYNAKPGQDQPEKQFKDFPDIIRYMVLEQPIYRSPEEDQNVIDLLERRYENAVKVRRR